MHLLNKLIQLLNEDVSQETPENITVMLSEVLNGEGKPILLKEFLFENLYSNKNLSLMFSFLINPENGQNFSSMVTFLTNLLNQMKDYQQGNEEVI